MSGLSQVDCAPPGTDEYLTRAQALVTALQSGEPDDVARLVDELTTLRESQMYQQLGRLTRELHDSLTNFCEDSRFSALAHDEIPDARERLKYVITLTQESADKTLTAVEQCVPVAEAISARAAALGEQWGEFRARRMTLAQFRELSGELNAFLAATVADADRLHTGLSEVLIAQEFQDLTGQMIQRVISLVDEVEDKLVSIIALSGQPPGAEGDADGDGTRAEGPSVPALAGAGVVSGQDEVDELLSSLGF